MTEKTTYDNVPISNPLASEIADLSSIQYDFDYVRDCTNELLNGNHRNETISRSLWIAGAITYRRPFTNGTAQVISQGPRFKLPEQWIDELDADLRSAHEEILKWANLQVAHHIGLKETYQVDALVNPDGMDRGFASTIVSHTVEILPDPKLIRAMQTLSVRFAEKSRGLRMEKTIQQRESLADADVNDFYDDPKKLFVRGKRGPRFNS